MSTEDGAGPSAEPATGVVLSEASLEQIIKGVTDRLRHSATSTESPSDEPPSAGTEIVRQM